MNELDVKYKKPIGAGSEHSIFPYKKFQDKIIKTYYGAINFKGSNPYLNINNTFDRDKSRLMKENPEFCAKVYKITERYAVIEKLNTKKFLADVEKINSCVFNYCIQDEETAKIFSIDVRNSDSSDIQLSMLIWYKALKNKDLLLKIMDHCNSEVFKKLVNFLAALQHSSLHREYNYLDIHDANFGYDKNGNIKLLDL